MSPVSQTPKNRLVAIVGGTGAGKGWLTSRLQALLGVHGCALSLDDFYRDRSHLPPGRRARLNFDTPRAIDWVGARDALSRCRLGRATRIPRYDFATHSRSADRVELQPAPIVLVEGLWLLVRESIRRLFDLTIYLDCPAAVRLERRRLRDIVERGRTPDSVDRQFESIAPSHERYVEPQKDRADLVLAHPFSEADLNDLADRLWTLLQAVAPSARMSADAFRRDLLTLLQSHELQARELTAT